METNVTKAIHYQSDVWTHFIDFMVMFFILIYYVFYYAYSSGTCRRYQNLAYILNYIQIHINEWENIMR